MVWPLNGMMTPGTPSQMGFAPSIGIAPLIAFTGMVTGWLTARGTCPIVNMTPTISAESRMPNTKRLLRVCISLITYALLCKINKKKELKTYNVSRKPNPALPANREPLRSSDGAFTLLVILLFRFLVHEGLGPDLTQQHTQLIPFVLRPTLVGLTFRSIEGSWSIVRLRVRLHRHPEEGDFKIHPCRHTVGNQLEQPGVRFLRQHPAEQRHPPADMILDELFLRIDHDVRLLDPIVTTRIGFLIGQEMHEFEFDAEVVQTLMDVFREFNSESLIKPCDVPHNMGLCEDVVVAEEGFIRRAIERDHIGEHPAMFRLEVADLPIDALG